MIYLHHILRMWACKFQRVELLESSGLLQPFEIFKRSDSSWIKESKTTAVAKGTLEITQLLVGYYSQSVSHWAKTSCALFWVPQKQTLRAKIYKQWVYYTVSWQHYRGMNRTGKGRRQKSETLRKLPQLWQIWLTLSLCRPHLKVEFSWWGGARELE